HPERLGDLTARHPQSAQRGDQLQPSLIGAKRHPRRRRRAIEQPLLALLAIAAPPLRDRSHADAGGLGRRRQRPALPLDPPDRQQTTMRAGPRVTVKHHPGSLLGAGCLAAPASKAARMEQRSQELQLAASQGAQLLHALAPSTAGDGFGKRMGELIDAELSKAKIARTTTGARRAPTGLKIFDARGLGAAAKTAFAQMLGRQADLLQ